MAFQYPPKDTWVDRMEVSYTDEYGTEIVAIYVQEKNLWVHRVVIAGSNVIGVNIYTDDVLTVPEKVEEIRETLRKKLRSFDINRDEDLARLDNQAEVNVQLVDYLRKLGESHLWVGNTEPPKDEDGDYMFIFWWKPIEEEMYIYINGEWVLSGLMEYDRPPIIQASPPTSHPKFPGKPLEEGDFWIDSLDEIYYWKYTNEDGSEGEWVQTRDADTNSDRPPIISDTEPTEHPKFPGEPLEEGDFWIDNHEGRAFTPMYYWTGTEWEELEHDENFDEDLKMHTCAQFYSKVPDYTGVDAKEGHFAACYDFGDSGIKWWTSPSQKSFYNNGDKIWVNDQGPYILEKLADVDKWTTFFLYGSPQPANGTTVKFSKTPKLCEAIDNLQQDIIELEEEIDAIAPSVERGFWTMNTSGVVSSQGQMSLYDDDYTNVGNPTDLFKDAKSIWLNELDNDGTPHGFEGVEAGELIELFVQGKAEYGLYEVVEAHDETNGAAQWWVIEVVFVRTLEDTSTADNGDIIRIKIFNAPSGGTADEFVLKEGDDMTGRLRMDTQDAEFEKDYRKPTDGNRAFIQLKNVASTSTKLASIWQPQATNEVALGSSVHIESIIYCNAWYGYVLSDAADGSGRRERITQEPNMQFLSFNGDDRGRLKWGGNDRINWTEAGGSLFSDNNQAKLTWNTEGIVLFKDSYGSFGTPGQVLTRTTDANYMQWATPAGQALTNWDLINANNKNWGNEFYHNALITGFGGYNSSGVEYNGQSNYGIFISDSMLEKLLKEDYPDKEIDIDKWVKYWTGEGTIELNTGGSGTSGTSRTRTLTEVKRVNYNNDGRYPGVKFMWTSGDSLSFYTLYIKFVKTAGAFEDTGEVNTIQVPASNILYYTGSYTPSREEDVNDSTVYWLDRNGRISNSTPSNGAFFPWAWIKENYPWMTGLNIMDGLGVSGIYDAFGNAKSLLDPTKTFNSFPAYVNPKEFNGVRGIGVWSDNQMASNDQIQIWGLQEDFEY